MSDQQNPLVSAVARNLAQLAAHRERLHRLEAAVAAFPVLPPAMPFVPPPQAASPGEAESNAALSGFYASVATRLAQANANTAALHDLAAAHGRTPPAPPMRQGAVIDVEVVEVSESVRANRAVDLAAASASAVDSTPSKPC